jgi:hypothetical protein
MCGGATRQRRTPRSTSVFAEAAFLAMTSFAVSANAQLDQQGHAKLTDLIEPLRPGMTEIQILDELRAHNALRNANLLEYSALRTYQVVDLKGKMHAEEVGRMEYREGPENVYGHVGERVGTGSPFGAEPGFEGSARCLRGYRGKAPGVV